MIDRYLLRYFLAVVDQGNFSKAAAQENVSQPTLSVGIAKLERLLGSELFKRSNRRVEVTEAGARFAVHARRIESEFNLAEASARAPSARTTFRLGVLTTIPSPRVAALSRALNRFRAEERVEYLEGREGELMEALKRNRIDAALTILPKRTARSSTEVLFTEGYSLAMPASHPLAREKSLPADALSDNTMIVRRHCELLAETSRFFTGRGVRPFFALRTNNDDRALACIQAGLGITVMPDSFHAPGVVRPRLQGFDFTRRIGLIFADTANHDKFAFRSPNAIKEEVIAWPSA